MQLIHIKKRYGNNEVLKDIHMTLKNRGLVFILGNSGSGKSTLLHIMGLIDHRYEGELVVNDAVFSKDRRSKSTDIGKNIDFVFQDFNLIDTLSVAENIQLASDIIGQKTEKTDVAEICNRLHLENCKNRRADRLSGGEKQRTAIGRALIRKNAVLLADEPTGNLDRENEENIFEILKEISRSRLVVVVTHNVDAAEKYGDRIIRLNRGEIEEDIDYGYQNQKENTVSKKKECKEQRKRRNRWIRRLAFSNLLHRRRKIIPSCLMMLLCILSLGGVMGLVYNTKKLVSGMDEGIMENDKKQIKCFDLEYGTSELPEEFLEKLYHIHGIRCSNAAFKSEFNVMKDGNIFSNCIEYEVIEDTDFYRERYHLIAGGFPQKETEIIVNKSFAEIYFDGEDAVGNTVLVDTIECGTITCTVAGIKEDTLMQKDEIYALPSFGELLYRTYMTEKASCFDFPNSKHRSSSRAFYLRLNLDEVKKEKSYQLIYGREPRQENELLIDIDTVNAVLQYIDREARYSNPDLAAGKLASEDLEAILEARMRYVGAFEKMDLAEVKITGICATDESLKEEYTDDDYGATAYMSDRFFETMLNRTYITDVTVYVKDSQAEKEIRQLCEEYGYQYARANREIVEEVGFKLTTIMSLLSLISIVVLLISMVMIKFSAKINAIDCAYEIGVLKSLGASNTFIFKRFLCENMIQGVVVGGIAALIGIVANVLELAKYEEINLLHFEWYYWIIIVLISILISVLSSLRENIKIARTDILTCIKNN